MIKSCKAVYLQCSRKHLCFNSIIQAKMATLSIANILEINKSTLKLKTIGT